MGRGQARGRAAKAATVLPVSHDGVSRDLFHDVIHFALMLRDCTNVHGGAAMKEFVMRALGESSVRVQNRVGNGFCAAAVAAVVDMVLDTGASTHVTTSREVLDEGSVEPCNVHIVGVGGRSLVASERGRVTLSFGGVKKVLTDVLVIRNAQLGKMKGPVHEPQVLIGVRKFAEDTGYGMHFLGDGKTVCFMDGDVCIARAATCDDDLYVVQSASVAQKYKTVLATFKVAGDKGVFGRQKDTVVGREPVVLSMSPAAGKGKAGLGLDPGSVKKKVTFSLPPTMAKKKTVSAAKRESFSRLLHRRIHFGKTDVVIRELKKAFGDMFEWLDEPCDACMWAKAKMRPVNKSSRRKATRVGERVHYDLFAAPVRSSAGYKYCLLVVDEFSSNVWVRGLRRKSELFSSLQGVINLIETRMRARVRELENGYGDVAVVRIEQIRSDNAKENVMNKMKALCKKKGTKMETSVPHQQWQNGKAERLGGVVMKGGRALQYGGGLPARDWFDCVCAFTHMRNRLPDAHSAEPGKRLTPYERFEDIAVPLTELMEHWLVIGCLCYVVVSPNSRALGEKLSEKAVLLGYADDCERGQKAYVLRRLRDGKRITATYAQVRPYENVLPYLEQAKVERVHDTAYGSDLILSDDSDDDMPDLGSSSEESDASDTSDDELDERERNQCDSEAPDSKDDGADDLSDSERNDTMAEQHVSESNHEADTGNVDSDWNHDQEDEHGDLRGLVKKAEENAAQSKFHKYGLRSEKAMRDSASIATKAAGGSAQAKPAHVPVGVSAQKVGAGRSEDDGEACAAAQPEPPSEAPRWAVKKIAGLARAGKKRRGEVIFNVVWETGETSWEKVDMFVGGAEDVLLSYLRKLPLSGVKLFRKNELARMFEKLGGEPSDIPTAHKVKLVEIEKEIAIALTAMIAAKESCGHKVPTTLKQCQQHEHWEDFFADMKVEFGNFNKKGVWELVELPKGANTVSVRWVWDIKSKDNVNVDRWKSRLVARGFKQMAGMDFDPGLLYAPTMRTKTLRFLLYIAARDGVRPRAYDVSCAFLHADLEEEVYVDQPPMFVVKGQERLVYKLVKAMYGLKQSPRAFAKHLAKCFKALGFSQSQADECLWYVRNDDGTYLYALYHVDDIIMVTNDDALRTQKFDLLCEVLDIRDEGDANVFTGIKFVYGDDGSIALSQETYIVEVARRFGAEDENGREVLPGGAPECDLSIDDVPTDPEELAEAKKLPYPALVGCLIYATKTRPEVSFAISDVAKYMSRWGRKHYNQAMRILRYLYRSRKKMLTYTKNDAPVELMAYVDANYGDKRDTGSGDKWRSQGGYLMYVGGQLISWRSKRHKCVALSSMEAEYVEATSAGQEVIWFRRLLNDFGYAQKEPTVILEDNKACISFSLNHTCHDRSKHIDIRHHWLRSMVEDKIVVLEHLPTNEQVADILTKHVLKKLFLKFRQMMLYGVDPRLVRQKGLGACVLCMHVGGEDFEGEHRPFTILDVDCF